jgi:hypothetical protein
MTRQIGLAALALAVTMALVSGSWAQTSDTSGSPASSSAKMGGSSAGNTGAEESVTLIDITAIRHASIEIVPLVVRRSYCASCCWIADHARRKCFGTAVVGLLVSRNSWLAANFLRGVRHTGML